MISEYAVMDLRIVLGCLCPNFFTVKMGKLRYGPDTGDLKPQTQMRLGINVEKAEKHDKGIVKLNI